MQTADLLKKVRKIEIKTRGLSSHLFTGGYHSAFKGRGMSFSEVRLYYPGDDVRAIDWNVTARAGEPYIKVFEEERENTVMLLVDVSGSAVFGSHAQFKEEYLTELCAVLAFSAIANNDKVGVMLFSDRIELFIPPKKGKQHILRIIREILTAKPSGRGTDLKGALQFIHNVLKKRSVCFILSDYLATGTPSNATCPTWASCAWPTLKPANKPGWIPPAVLCATNTSRPSKCTGWKRKTCFAGRAPIF